MKNFFYKKCFFILGAMGLIGCGAVEPQMIKNFTYSVKENSLEFDLEFQKNLELNTDLIIPIKEYGEIKVLAPFDGQGLKLVADLQTSVFLDQDFFAMERTPYLPNGQDMSAYVQTVLTRVRFQPHDKIGTSLYLGLENPDKKYLGASIELNFIDQNFPQGLVISQRLRDSQDRPLGVITFYGPKLENNRLVAPGGFFFVTNISDLWQYSRIPQTQEDKKLLPDFETYINEPYKKIFLDPKKSIQLFDLYKKSAKNAQLID